MRYYTRAPYFRKLPCFGGLLGGAAAEFRIRCGISASGLGVWGLGPFRADNFGGLGSRAI